MDLNNFHRLEYGTEVGLSLFAVLLSLLKNLELLSKTYFWLDWLLGLTSWFTSKLVHLISGWWGCICYGCSVFTQHYKLRYWKSLQHFLHDNKVFVFVRYTIGGCLIGRALIGCPSYEVTILLQYCSVYPL